MADGANNHTGNGLARVAALAVVLGGLAMAPSVGASDQVYDFRGDDPAMNEAMEQARANLPYFFAALETGVAADFLLKVPVDASDVGLTLEHIWMNQCQAGAAKEIACVIANAPQTSNVAQGDIYEFDIAEITDWAYFDAEGMMHGAYTIRVILPQLDAEQAASYRAILAPLPE